MKVRFAHYRIPMGDESGCKGAPPDKCLYRYSRKQGFLSDTRFLVHQPPQAKGGKTTCVISIDDSTSVVGISRCSLSDNFSYGIGRAIAFKRALRSLASEYREIVAKLGFIEKYSQEIEVEGVV